LCANVTARQTVLGAAPRAHGRPSGAEPWPQFTRTVLALIAVRVNIAATIVAPVNARVLAALAAVFAAVFKGKGLAVRFGFRSIVRASVLSTDLKLVQVRTTFLFDLRCACLKPMD
jgi:hypothetical protein